MLESPGQTPGDRKPHVQVGASVGAALLRTDATPAEIITAADRAMYARKDERRGLPSVDYPGSTN